jgi:hypothetical protein
MTRKTVVTAFVASSFGVVAVSQHVVAQGCWSDVADMGADSAARRGSTRGGGPVGKRYPTDG